MWMVKTTWVMDTDKRMFAYYSVFCYRFGTSNKCDLVKIIANNIDI